MQDWWSWIPRLQPSLQTWLWPLLRSGEPLRNSLRLGLGIALLESWYECWLHRTLALSAVLCPLSQILSAVQFLSCWISGSTQLKSWVGWKVTEPLIFPTYNYAFFLMFSTLPKVLFLTLNPWISIFLLPFDCYMNASCCIHPRFSLFLKLVFVELLPSPILIVLLLL